MSIDWARYNKFWVALVTTAAEAVSLGLVPKAEVGYVQLGIAFFGALGVYAVPNKVTTSSAGQPPAARHRRAAQAPPPPPPG